MRGLADTSRLIDGKHASLASIGYSDAGIGDTAHPCPLCLCRQHRRHASSCCLCLQMTAG